MSKIPAWKKPILDLFPNWPLESIVCGILNGDFYDLMENKKLNSNEMLYLICKKADKELLDSLIANYQIFEYQPATQGFCENRNFSDEFLLKIFNRINEYQADQYSDSIDLVDIVFKFLPKFQKLKNPFVIKGLAYKKDLLPIIIDHCYIPLHIRKQLLFHSLEILVTDIHFLRHEVSEIILPIIDELNDDEIINIVQQRNDIAPCLPLGELSENLLKRIWNIAKREISKYIYFNENLPTYMVKEAFDANREDKVRENTETRRQICFFVQQSSLSSEELRYLWTTYTNQDGIFIDSTMLSRFLEHKSCDETLASDILFFAHDRIRHDKLSRIDNLAQQRMSKEKYKIIIEGIETTKALTK